MRSIPYCQCTRDYIHTLLINKEFLRNFIFWTAPFQVSVRLQKQRVEWAYICSHQEFSTHPAQGIYLQCLSSSYLCRLQVFPLITIEKFLPYASHENWSSSTHHGEYVSYGYDFRMQLSFTYLQIDCVGNLKQIGAAKYKIKLSSQHIDSCKDEKTYKGG